MIYRTLLLLLCVCMALPVLAATSAETLQLKQFNALDAENLREVVPGVWSMRHINGEHTTAMVLHVAEGQGQTLPVKKNIHMEEAVYIIRGSVRFFAGDGTFTRVFREGDLFVLPKCIAHWGTFGYDNNEETIMLSVFSPVYEEYGPDDAVGPVNELLKKLKQARNTIDYCEGRTIE
ncbi:MAG: hypothetical protein J4A00_05990 [Gammaproteobacteria bacterium]|nr:hypothetical protein [Gammaproteobacteria bacterium]